MHKVILNLSGTRFQTLLNPDIVVLSINIENNESTQLTETCSRAMTLLLIWPESVIRLAGWLMYRTMYIGKYKTRWLGATLLLPKQET